MTSVEECTKAEIGVGAAIAKGNHGEKGKIALFVMKVIPRRKIMFVEIIIEEKWNKSG